MLESHADAVNVTPCSSNGACLHRLGHNVRSTFYTLLVELDDKYEVAQWECRPRLYRTGSVRLLKTKTPIFHQVFDNIEDAYDKYYDKVFDRG